MNGPDLRILGLRQLAGRRSLLDIPSLSFAPGQTVAIMGASGAGKSTFLQVIAGLLAPTEGQIHWGGTSLTGLGPEARARLRRQSFGLIFQDFQLFPQLSAQGNAAIAAQFAPKAERAALRARAAHWLDRLGLGQAGGRSVSSFSGGERQRIAVARALAGDPPVILADEPTASLDRPAAEALGADLVALAREKGLMLVVVTHDMALAERMDRRLTLADGIIARDSHG